jgi:hypothetical protein
VLLFLLFLRLKPDLDSAPEVFRNLMARATGNSPRRPERKRKRPRWTGRTISPLEETRGETPKTNLSDNSLGGPTSRTVLIRFPRVSK